MTQTDLPNDSQSWLLLLIEAIRHHWFMVLACTFVLGGLGLYQAFASPLIYRAETVMIPAPGIQDANSMLGGLGGLAGLVGAGGDSNHKLEALAILRSRAFNEEFISSRKLRPILFADQFDQQTGRWKDDEEPSLYAAYLLFHEDIRRIEENTSEGTVTIAVEWTDRELAAQWSNALANELNQNMRERAISKFAATLTYLRTELDKNSEAGIRQGIYDLIEENTRSIALANVQKEYAFSVVDAAAPPDADAFSKPKRLILILASLIIGFVVGLLLALLRRVIATLPDTTAPA